MRNLQLSCKRDHFRNLTVDTIYYDNETEIRISVTGSKCTDYINLAGNGDGFKHDNDLWFVPKVGNFFTKWVTINFPRKTMFYVASFTTLRTFDTLSHSPGDRHPAYRLTGVCAVIGSCLLVFSVQVACKFMDIFFRKKNSST
jgi:hypothetical protein